ncbi:MAG: GntR family transcriptional regulator [Fimbriimonadaceae bacterium]|nr:GntR family transcriptional regulator [Fimbriimonadaceae bacterium]
MATKVPVYQQLCEQLATMVREGQVAAGGRFLTERQVAERFRVSRVTANKALASLVSEGLLEFRKGVGTFVRRPAMDYDLRALVSYTDKAREAGIEPSTEVFCCERRASEATLAARLKLFPGEPLWYLERLRLADEQPMILEHRWIAARLCDDLTVEDVAGSLFGLWTDRYGLRVGSAEQVIRAVVVTAAEAERLGIDALAAALEVTGVGFLDDGRPLWYERTLYRGDAFAFRQHLGGETSSTNAVRPMAREATA